MNTDFSNHNIPPANVPQATAHSARDRGLRRRLAAVSVASAVAVGAATWTMNASYAAADTTAASDTDVEGHTTTPSAEHLIAVLEAKAPER